jgi:hypothetical protein
MLARQELAVQRMGRAQQQQAQHLQQHQEQGLQTAAQRRQALQDLQLERLRQDHRLVMDRLVRGT